MDTPDFPTDLIRNSAILRENSIIVPPSSDSLKELRTRRVRVLVDSRDRDYTAFPNPARYRLDLDEDVRDVVSVQLVAYNIPFSHFNVSKTNNLVHVVVRQVTYTLAIPMGEYDGESLAVMLNNLMDYEYLPEHDQDTLVSQILTRMPILPIRFTYRPNTNTMQVHHTGVDDAAFTAEERACVIKFSDNQGGYITKTVARTLGFPPADIILELDAPPVRGTFSMDLRPDPYIALFLDGAKACVSNNLGINQCFAILHIDANSDGNQLLSLDLSKRFAKPLAQLKQVSVQFRTRDGDLYDFQNKEHCLDIVYTCYRQTVAYDAIFKPGIV